MGAGHLEHWHSWLGERHHLHPRDHGAQPWQAWNSTCQAFGAIALANCSDSQIWGCIRISAGFIKMQIAGPHPQSFRFSRSGLGPENAYFLEVPMWCRCSWFGDRAWRTTGPERTNWFFKGIETRVIKPYSFTSRGKNFSPNVTIHGSTALAFLSEVQ